MWDVVKLVLIRALSDAVSKGLSFGILGLASLLALKSCDVAVPRPSIGDGTPPGTVDNSYSEVREIVNRMKSHTGQIRALKQSGKVVGSEHGLLNPVNGKTLSIDEQSLLHQENDDRRKLYLYIAEHSDPPVSYERVANEYAMKRWKEWPPE